MRNPDATGKTGIQDKAELALHLWEGLVRELVERNVLRARYNCYGGIEVECAVVTGWTG